jgi:hypothetical protein
MAQQTAPPNLKESACGTGAQHRQNQSVHGGQKRAETGAYEIVGHRKKTISIGRYLEQIEQKRDCDVRITEEAEQPTQCERWVF